MIAEVLERNLNAILVSTAITQISDGLGFYHLEPRNQIWFLLEYSGITPTPIFTEAERKLLLNAKEDNVLNDMYRQLYFEKKESALLKHRLGMTALNRRRLVKNEDDPDALPTSDDILQFSKKIEKYKPRLTVALMKPELFEKCFKPIYPAALRTKGKQAFLIGESEVWLAGSTTVRKDAEELEQMFEDIAGRIIPVPKT